MLIFVPCQRTDVFFARIVMPALALERVRVHHALGDDLIVAKGAGLAEHLVHERGLAVIDVGDDGDVADLQGVTS